MESTRWNKISNSFYCSYPPEAIFLDNLSMCVCHRYRVSRKIWGSLFLRTCDYFCVLRELIFAIRTDLFFLVGINSAIFTKYPGFAFRSLRFVSQSYFTVTQKQTACSLGIVNIFVFIKHMQQKYTFSNNTTVCVPY